MSSFPAWTIFVIVVAIIMTIFSGTYYIFRKRISKKKSTVGTQESAQDNLDKETSHSYDIEANIDTHKEKSIHLTSSTMSKSVYSHKSGLSERSGKTMDSTQTSTMPHPVYSKKQTEDNTTGTIKINLPLPPPCSSFFSDKMELNSDEANYLFEAYSQQEASSAPPEDRHLISIAAANIQLKAATIKSTLRQSLRRKKSSAARHTPINQYFPNNLANMPNLSNSASVSRQPSRASSRIPLDDMPFQNTPSSTPDSFPSTPRCNTQTEYFNDNTKAHNLTVPLSQYKPGGYEESASNKIMIEDSPSADYYSAMSTSSFSFHSRSSLKEIDLQDDSLQTTERQEKALDLSEEEDDSNGEERKELTTPQEVASAAARKIIRSASRKSRTRSVIVTKNVNQPIPINDFTIQDTIPMDKKTTTYATLRETTRRHSRLDITEFSTIGRADKRVMTSISSGSITISGKKANRIQELQRAFQEDNKDIQHASHHSYDRSLSLRNLGANKGHKSLKSLFESADDDQEPKSNQVNGSHQEINMAVQPMKSKETPHAQPDGQAPPSMPTVCDAKTITPNTPTEKRSPNKSTFPKSGNNVDTIRRMLRSSWSGNNLKHSGSSRTLSSLSDMGSVGSSYYPSSPSPLGSTNTRLQNQHLASLSLRSHSVVHRSRPSMPIGFMSPQEGPVPTASFSSSTVRTMIPAEEVEEATIRELEVQEADMPDRKAFGINVESCCLQEQEQSNQAKTAAQRERERYLKSFQ
ncbi:hypothetical protein EDC96DRAFT_569388 [Choanephora cucurbitarum]|nr:hypothetical protein EDC96DRAFT_569388 [Choanephora cucurbitarum]